MKGLELIKKAFALQPVERVPWVPFVGVHGGFLIDKSAKEYLNSTENIISGLEKAIELLVLVLGHPASLAVRMLEGPSETARRACLPNWRLNSPLRAIWQPWNGGRFWN